MIHLRVDLRRAPGSAAARSRRLAESPQSGGEQREDELKGAGEEAVEAAEAAEVTETASQTR